MGKYTHLTISDRRCFYTLLEIEFSMTEITKQLSKHRSTLYREVNAIPRTER
uniref:helix-turn-helix domain-containing protein n=1 Tax=Coxiella endosymbiont of Ornithodoros maritimus TaxID=1656172 RepID=UPI003898D7A3